MFTADIIVIRHLKISTLVVSVLVFCDQGIICILNSLKLLGNYFKNISRGGPAPKPTFWLGNGIPRPVRDTFIGP